jgi:hypothetical protein
MPKALTNEIIDYPGFNVGCIYAMVIFSLFGKECHSIWHGLASYLRTTFYIFIGAVIFSNDWLGKVLYLFF